MKRILLIALLLGPPLCAIHAQRDVLTRGGDFSSAGGSVAWSIGQIAYTYYTGEAGSVSLGVQQPNLFTIVGTNDPGEWLAVNLYPNPASEAVYVDLLDANVLKQFNSPLIRVLDVQGKLVSEKQITEVLTAIPLTGLSESVYVLQIMNGQEPVKSFKLCKSN